MTWYHPALAQGALRESDDEIRGLKAKNERLRSALTHCLTVLCEAGDLNNYRTLSDVELGKLWVATAKEAAEALNT